MDGVGHGLRCQCSLIKGRRWVWVYVCMFEINAPTAITTRQALRQGIASSSASSLNALCSAPSSH